MQDIWSFSINLPTISLVGIFHILLPRCCDYFQERSPNVRESGFPGVLEIFSCGIRNWSRKNLLWNPESWALESGIQLKESGIPLTIGIRNPSSTDKESVTWNPEFKNVLDSLTSGERSPKKTSIKVKRTLESSNKNTATSRPRTFDRTHISLCQALR